mgnify:CR=1 FL=1
MSAWVNSAERKSSANSPRTWRLILITCGAREHDPAVDVGLCGVVVLVDQPAEDGCSSDAVGGLVSDRLWGGVVGFWAAAATAGAFEVAVVTGSVGGAIGAVGAAGRDAVADRVYAGFDGPALAMDAYAFAAPDAVRVGPLVVSP